MNEEKVNELFEEAEEAVKIIGDMKHRIYSIESIPNKSDLEKARCLLTIIEEGIPYLQMIKTKALVLIRDLKGAQQ